MSNVIRWFDMPATDLDRAAKFYETVLAIMLMRENMLGARMAIFPAKSGEATGATIARDGATPGTTGPTVYLKAGADLSGALSRVPAAGGKVLHPKTFIKKGWGYFAIILDSEGNSMGLHSINWRFQPAIDYSAEIPALRMTAPSRFMSALIAAANCSGVLPMVSIPTLRNRSFASA